MTDTTAREAARAYADAEFPELRLSPENETYAEIAERAYLAGYVFRRPVQGELECACDFPIAGHDAPSGELFGNPEQLPSEPTDTQIVAALDAYWKPQHAGPWSRSQVVMMRAALRAAAATEQGEN